MFIKDHARHKVSIQKNVAIIDIRTWCPTLLTKLKVAKLRNSGFLFVHLPCILQLPDQTAIQKGYQHLRFNVIVSSTCDFL